MNIGSLSPRSLRATVTTFLLQRGGLSFNWSVTSFRVPLEHNSPAFQYLETLKTHHRNKSRFHLDSLYDNLWVSKVQGAMCRAKERLGAAAIAKPNEGEKRPRGKTNSKANDKSEFGLALQETLNSFITQKVVREERKHQEEEEQMRLILTSTNRSSRSRTQVEELKLAKISKKVKIVTMNLSKMYYQREDFRLRSK